MRDRLPRVRSACLRNSLQTENDTGRLVLMNEDETIAFRAPRELAGRLKSEAKKDDRKLSEWLRRHFAEFFGEKASKRRGRK
jgi:hypothetical protein